MCFSFALKCFNSVLLVYDVTCVVVAVFIVGLVAGAVLLLVIIICAATIVAKRRRYHNKYWVNTRSLKFLSNFGIKLRTL